MPLPIAQTIMALCLASVASLCSATERTVGLVMLTPHNIHLTGVGLTVFSNRYAETGRRDKAIEEAVYQLLRRELELEPGTKVHQVAMPIEWIADRAPKTYKEGSSFFPSKVLGLEADIPTLIKECQCTDLVLVSDRLQTQYAGTNQSVRGPSVWTNLRGNAQMVIPLSLVRINGATGERTASAFMTVASDSFTFMWPDTQDKVLSLPEGVIEDAARALQKREAHFQKWFVHGTREGWFKLGLRPSCAVPAYEATKRQRGSGADFDSPPSVAPGADPQTCPVTY